MALFRPARLFRGLRPNERSLAWHTFHHSLPPLDTIGITDGLVPTLARYHARQSAAQTLQDWSTTVAIDGVLDDGARLDDIVHTVRPPAHLLERPYLQPIYDEPEFVVRNIWRLYGGWYDGDPSHLKPAPPAVLAQELASLGLPKRAMVSGAVGHVEMTFGDAHVID